ncbi:MAG: HNH endonuclease [Hydrogenophilales bacterium]|nr:HNH endonuclease [Hydrogenophilales bacterium]
MNQHPSEVGGKAYIGRWDTWVKALEAFVDRVKQDEPAPVVGSGGVAPNPDPGAVPFVSAKEDVGRVRLGVRYKVLVRDNFKCVLCGNSPATEPTCHLHVDHIHPHSKGGSTTIENLRTLCGACNMGKSNLTIEGVR